MGKVMNIGDICLYQSYVNEIKHFLKGEKNLRHVELGLAPSFPPIMSRRNNWGEMAFCPLNKFCEVRSCSCAEAQDMFCAAHTWLACSCGEERCINPSFTCECEFCLRSYELLLCECDVINDYRTFLMGLELPVLEEWQSANLTQ